MAQWIFVTEDDDGIREMIQIALESLSYQVSVFATAEETLAAVIKETPDLFIFDIMLPGMDGITAVQQLRTAARQLAADHGVPLVKGGVCQREFLDGAGYI